MIMDTKAELKTMTKTIQCLSCMHFHVWVLDKKSCAAFPDGIPDDIVLGQVEHNKRHPDQQNDIVYESDPPKSYEGPKRHRSLLRRFFPRAF